MIFAKRLRDRVRNGEITCSVRIWMRPHVKVGNRYRMDEGEIEVVSVLPMTLKTAKHGRGENVYLVRFRYLPPRRPTAGQGRAKGKGSARPRT